MNLGALKSVALYHLSLIIFTPLVQERNIIFFLHFFDWSQHKVQFSCILRDAQHKQAWVFFSFFFICLFFHFPFSILFLNFMLICFQEDFLHFRASPGRSLWLCFSSGLREMAKCSSLVGYDQLWPESEVLSTSF